MTLQEELTWMYSLTSKGIKLGLGPARELAKAVDNPEKKFKSIHIAGTNGKGSTARILYSILREAGFKVGIYTSPHLVRFNERIIVDEKEISNEEIVNLITKLKGTGVDATFFEFTTLIAFLYFEKKNVDYAILETGMGGRLDATNIVSPEFTIITKISYDHQQYLGNTIKEIAGEKAGIIKENTLVITCNTGEALEVIKQIAKEKNAKVLIPELPRQTAQDLYTQTAELNNYKIKTTLLGKHQLENIGTAILSAEQLNISKEVIEEGIKKASWSARLQVINKDPIIILDGSHNVEGFTNLKEFVQENLKEFVLVLGISYDKDIEEMTKLIAPLAKKVILTKAKMKGAPTSVLKKFIKNAEEFEEPAEAVKAAIKSNLPVLITGSLYLAGEVMTFLEQ